MQRRELWVKAALDTEHEQFRRELLEKMLSQTRGSIVAGIKVPLRRFFGIAFYLVAGPATLVKLSFSYEDPAQFASIALFYVTTIFWGVRSGIRIYCERVSVREQYVRATTQILEPDLGILNRMEGGRRIELLWALFISLGVVAFSIGLSLVFRESPGLGFGLIVPGIIGVQQTLIAVSEYAIRVATQN